MECRGNQLMMRTFLVRALSFAAVAALTLNPALTPVVAADYRTVAPVARARHRQIRRDRSAA
jgi:pilus assembly protein CpaC